MSTVVNVMQTRMVGRAFTRVVNESVKYCLGIGSGVYSVQKAATDSIGTTTVTLTNVVVGSRYRIEVASTGALAEPAANAEGTTSNSDPLPITLNLYAAGNSNNSLRIKVRKGSAATKYQPFETQVTLSAQAQSVYIAQVPDPIA